MGRDCALPCQPATPGTLVPAISAGQFLQLSMGPMVCICGTKCYRGALGLQSIVLTIVTVMVLYMWVQGEPKRRAFCFSQGGQVSGSVRHFPGWDLAPFRAVP